MKKFRAGYILSVILLKAYSLLKTQRECTDEYNTFPTFLGFFFSWDFSRPRKITIYKEDMLP